MARRYLSVYFDMIPVIETLSDAEAGRLLKGALRYSAFNEPPSFSGSERVAWPSFMDQIDKDNAKSKHISETNRQNVTKRYERIRSNTVVNDRSDRKERSKEKSINNNTRFIPPSVEEVEAYCRERNNDIDAQHFVDYYASNGWRVGKNPMKDWRATVRNWERSDSVKPRQEPKKSGNIFLDILHELGETDVTL